MKIFHSFFIIFSQKYFDILFIFGSLNGIIYGVDNNNYRKLLHLSVNPTEGASSWEECLKEIKKRGVENIDLAIADGIIPILILNKT